MQKRSFRILFAEKIISIMFPSLERWPSLRRRLIPSRRQWRWVAWLLTVAVLGYVLVIFFRNIPQLRAVNWPAYWLAIPASLGLYLVSLIVQFVIWARIISAYGQVSWRDAEIYARMVLMRSLPGGPWHWLGRTAMYSNATEIPARAVVRGSFYEWAIFLLTGAAAFLVTLSEVQLALRLAFIGLTAGAAIGLAVAWQPASRPWALRLIEGGFWVMLSGAAWASGGMIVYVLARASGGNSLTVLEAIGAWAVAGGVGLIIIILPASLGIREVTLASLLQPYLPLAVALLVAVMVRLVFTVADLLWGASGWAFSKIILRRQSIFRLEEG